MALFYVFFLSVISPWNNPFCIYFTLFKFTQNYRDDCIDSTAVTTIYSEFTKKINRFFYLDDLIYMRNETQRDKTIDNNGTNELMPSISISFAHELVVLLYSWLINMIKINSFLQQQQQKVCQIEFENPFVVNSKYNLNTDNNKHEKFCSNCKIN